MENIAGDLYHTPHQQAFAFFAATQQQKRGETEDTI
jgi:hypothetical protein